MESTVSQRARTPSSRSVEDSKSGQRVGATGMRSIEWESPQSGRAGTIDGDSLIGRETTSQPRHDRHWTVLLYLANLCSSKTITSRLESDWFRGTLPIRWATPLAAILISVEVLKRSLGVNAGYSQPLVLVLPKGREAIERFKDSRIKAVKQ